MVSKPSEIISGMFIPDPDLDFLPIPDPVFRSKKCTRSQIPDRNCNTEFEAKKKVGQLIFSLSSFVAVVGSGIWDPGWIKVRMRDLG
jgi:hypothetical protein